MGHQNRANSKQNEIMITIRYLSGDTWIFRSFPTIQEAQKAIVSYRKRRIFAEHAFGPITKLAHK